MRFDVQDAKAVLSELVELARSGEEVTITKAGKPVARLVRFRQPGSWKGKICISPDFDKVDEEIEALFYDGEIEPPA
jgi:prevent-host-death family protein